MGKLSKEEKIEMYNKKKDCVTIPTLVSQYGMTKHGIWYIIYLIDRHGFKILDKEENNCYSKEFKLKAINRIIKNKSSPL